jgi:hypothetical protein
LISGVFFCLKPAQPFSEGRFFFAGARFSNKYNRRTQREDFEHPRAFLRSKGRSFFADRRFYFAKCQEGTSKFSARKAGVPKKQIERFKRAKPQRKQA